MPGVFLEHLRWLDIYYIYILYINTIVNLVPYKKRTAEK